MTMKEGSLGDKIAASETSQQMRGMTGGSPYFHDVFIVSRPCGTANTDSCWPHLLQEARSLWSNQMVCSGDASSQLEIGSLPWKPCLPLFPSMDTPWQHSWCSPNFQNPHHLPMCALFESPQGIGRAMKSGRCVNRQLASGWNILLHLL